MIAAADRSAGSSRGRRAGFRAGLPPSTTRGAPAEGAMARKPDPSSDPRQVPLHTSLREWQRRVEIYLIREQGSERILGVRDRGFDVVEDGVSDTVAVAYDVPDEIDEHARRAASDLWE